MQIRSLKIYDQEIIRDIPFVIYDYDENLAQKPNYIDVRSIVQKNEDAWLKDLQKSHAKLAEGFCFFSRWWWITAASRLDARPWVQEYAIKPLFFARALLSWIQKNPNCNEIILVGCPLDIHCYLKQFDLLSDFKFEGIKSFFLAMKNSFFSIFRAMKLVWFYVCNHLFKKKPIIVSSRNLVFYELINGFSLSDGHKFYFGDLFDEIPQDQITYVISADSSIDVKKLRNNESDNCFLLCDLIDVKDLILGICTNFFLIFVNWIFFFRNFSCTIENKSFKGFFRRYLFSEINRLPVLSNYLTFCSFNKIFRNQLPGNLIFPYEEKGIERAILFSADKHRLKCIGYLPHPQHKLAVALRTIYHPENLYLKNFAVCGSQYIKHLKEWGGKSDCSVSVWGSGKEFIVLENKPDFRKEKLKILFLVSHPNELRVFKSWLENEKSLTEGVAYYLRLYKATKLQNDSFPLDTLINKFNCVRVAEGSLDQNLRDCDISIFCATSAGIVSVKKGILTAYVDLNDFFQINPCFDDLSEMMSCQNSRDFKNLLEKIRSMSLKDYLSRKQRQKEFCDQIFCDANKHQIKKDLMNAEIRTRVN